MIPQYPRMPEPAVGASTPAGGSAGMPVVPMVGADAPIQDQQIQALHTQAQEAAVRASADVPMSTAFKTGLQESPIGKALMQGMQPMYYDRALPSAEFLQNSMRSAEDRSGQRLSAEARGSILGSRSEQEAQERIQTHINHSQAIREIGNNPVVFAAGVLAGDPTVVVGLGVGVAGMVAKTAGTAFKVQEAVALSETLTAVGSTIDGGITASRMGNALLGAGINVAAQKMLRDSSGGQGYGVTAGDYILDGITGAAVAAFVPLKRTRGLVHAAEEEIPSIQKALAVDTKQTAKMADGTAWVQDVPRTSPKAQFSAEMRRVTLAEDSVALARTPEARGAALQGINRELGEFAFPLETATAAEFKTHARLLYSKATADRVLINAADAAALGEDAVGTVRGVLKALSEDMRVVITSGTDASVLGGSRTLSDNLIHVTLRPGMTTDDLVKAALHEPGHGIFTKELGLADEATKNSLFQGWLKNAGVEDSLAASADMSTLMRESPKRQAFLASLPPEVASKFSVLMPGRTDAATYWNSLAEYGAQQLVRHVQEVIADPVKGRASRIYTSLPESTKRLVEGLVERFKAIFGKLHDSGLLKADPAYAKFFEGIAERVAQGTPNPKNLVRTVVDEEPGVQAWGRMAAVDSHPAGTPIVLGDSSTRYGVKQTPEVVSAFTSVIGKNLWGTTPKGLPKKVIATNTPKGLYYTGVYPEDAHILTLTSKGEVAGTMLVGEGATGRGMVADMGVEPAHRRLGLNTTAAALAKDTWPSFEVLGTTGSAYTKQGRAWAKTVSSILDNTPASKFPAFSPARKARVQVSASAHPATKGTPVTTNAMTADVVEKTAIDVPKVRTVDELPPIPPSIGFDIHAGAAGWSDRIFGKGWASYWDKMQSYGGKVARLGNALLSNGMGSSAASAAQFKRTASLQLEMLWAPVEQSVVDSLGFSKWDRVWRAKEFRGALNVRMGELQELVQRKSSAFLKGEELPVSADAALERMAQQYGTSGFAERALKYLQTAERTGADAVQSNPWYLPVRHDANQYGQIVLSGKGTVDDIKGLYTAQSAQMFPDMEAAWHQKMGASLYDSMRERASGRSADSLHFEGLTREDIEAGMLRAGLDPQDVEELLGRYTRAGLERSKDKNLKRRLDWDWELEIPTSTGQTLSMRDVTQADVSHTIGQYIQTVSGQHGLGMVGIRNNNDLRSLIQESVDELPNLQDHRAARQSLENAAHSLLGRSVGEAVPKIVQAANTIAGSLVLRNSGVYNAGELANAIHVFGASKMVRAMTKSGALDGLREVKDPTVLSTLAEVVSGANITDGRWRAVVTRTEDGHYLPASFLDGVNQLGQGTKFFNGLEATRRAISNAVVSLGAGELDLAIKGNAQSAAVLARYGFTPELLADITVQAEKHGMHPARWEPKTQVLAENALQNLADQINQAQRVGEIPEFMQTSVLGKIMLPYTSFNAGAYNKILRKAGQDGGVHELGSKFLFGVGAGVLIEGAKNVLAGRAPEDSGKGNFVMRAVGNAPMVSWYGTGADLLSGKSSMRLQLQAGPAALHTLAKDPSAVNVAKAIPLVAVSPIPAIVSHVTEE